MRHDVDAAIVAAVTVCHLVWFAFRLVVGS